MLMKKAQLKSNSLLTNNKFWVLKNYLKTYEKTKKHEFIWSYGKNIGNIYKLVMKIHDALS